LKFSDNLGFLIDTKPIRHQLASFKFFTSRP
jgi:hypothetical protein